MQSKKTHSNSAKMIYSMTDATGQFFLERISGVDKKSNTFITKRRIYSQDNQAKDLERSITISDQGHLDKKLQVLRPKRSQFEVWFDSKKYFTEMKLDTSTKSLVLKMISPEAQWNGTSKIPFPKGTGVFCFFSQIVECVRKTNFFEVSSNKNAGQMNFHIIWDGYPYFQEQYSDIPNEVFTPAQMIYDGQTKDGLRKYTIIFGEQTIFVHIDENENLTKMFWISQSLTVVRLDQEDGQSEKGIQRKSKINKKRKTENKTKKDNNDRVDGFSDFQDENNAEEEPLE